MYRNIHMKLLLKREFQKQGFMEFILEMSRKREGLLKRNSNVLSSSQEQVAEVFQQKASNQNKRYQNMIIQMRNQHYSSQRQWRAWRSFLTGERGAWSDG